MAPSVKQNVTISLAPELVRKVKVLAAQRSTSISKLLAQHVAAIVGADEAYERARVSAMERMKHGFHLGGVHKLNRDELHER